MFVPLAAGCDHCPLDWKCLGLRYSDWPKMFPSVGSVCVCDSCPFITMSLSLLKGAKPRQPEPCHAECSTVDLGPLHFVRCHLACALDPNKLLREKGHSCYQLGRGKKRSLSLAPRPESPIAPGAAHIAISVYVGRA